MAEDFQMKTDKQSVKQFIDREDIEVVSMEALTLELPPKNGFRIHAPTGSTVIILYNKQQADIARQLLNQSRST